jgi:hypothetical protein
MKRNSEPGFDAYDVAYLYLAAIFLAALVVCNLIVQKFFLWEPLGIKNWFYLSAGILPYPLTFLVTDILSECYGRRRANQVVYAGFVASVFVLGVVLLADSVKSVGAVDLLTGEAIEGRVFDRWFHQIFGTTGRAIAASMAACLVAQLIDIRIFHFWRRVTGGKHLWLRNNASTILSQLVDTTLVVTFLFVGTSQAPNIPKMIVAGWSFKAFVALLDTPFFYGAVFLWRRWFPEIMAARDQMEVGSSNPAAS